MTRRKLRRLTIYLTTIAAAVALSALPAVASGASEPLFVPLSEVNWFSVIAAVSVAITGVFVMFGEL